RTLYRAVLPEEAADIAARGGRYHVPYGREGKYFYPLAFPVSQEEKKEKQQGMEHKTDKVLVYNDQFLQTGQVRLTIEKGSFSHIPELKL
ncbi:MAG TPA: hypothetical protein VLB84_06895, partial [Bacteroidia bacterium]|nr:hypothetical protein [Bacteroidia bacterium]